VAATRASNFSSTVSDAGDWFICDRGDWFICGLNTEEAGVLGVLKAPVEARCRRSNSSCSFGGRRGGEGPVAKAGRGIEVLKRRREDSRRRRDIVTVLMIVNL